LFDFFIVDGLKGKHVPKNVKHAFEWYTKGSKRNNMNAIVNLSRCYERGVGVESDGYKAHEWRVRAAELGHAVSQYNLGIHYRKATGGITVRDHVKAVEWLTKASDNKDSDADILLGDCYESGGYGIPKDEKVAFGWYSKGAERKNASAFVHMSRCYKEGLYLPAYLVMARSDSCWVIDGHI
jgi:TPR repeat protein